MENATLEQGVTTVLELAEYPLQSFTWRYTNFYNKAKYMLRVLLYPLRKTEAQ
jgi:hypothetical protein